MTRIGRFLATPPPAITGGTADYEWIGWPYKVRNSGTIELDGVAVAIQECLQKIP